MGFFWLANLVAAAHGLLVLAEIAGAVAAITGFLRHYPRWERPFYALLGAVVASELLLGECFLTRLEKLLRSWHQPGSAYRRSFIGHYVPGLPPAFLAWFVPALLLSALLAFPIWRWIDHRRAAGKR